MKITKDHLLFWQDKKCLLPTWYQDLIPKMHHVSIHTLINSQVSSEWDEAHNTLAVLRMARKRGALVEVLARMAQCPGTVINPQRRAAHCKKWLKRILETESPQHRRLCFFGVLVAWS